MSLDRAIELALRNPVIDLRRMAAVICYKNKEICWGWNSRKTHPLAYRYKRDDHQTRPWVHNDSIHAELAALAAAKRDVEGMTMYVARVLRNDQIVLAKPCSGCTRALNAFGIKQVIFTQ